MSNPGLEPGTNRLKAEYSTIELVTQYNMFLRKYNENSYILMMSNGQDSIYLFFIILTLIYLKKQTQKNLKLYYCYHLWQKNNNDSLLQTIKIIFSFRIFVFISINYKKFEKNKKLQKNNEIIARLWRLQSIERFLLLTKKSLIFQGHTLSDIIETFFLFFYKKKKKYKNLKAYNNFEIKQYLFSNNLLKYTITFNKKKSNFIYLKNSYYILINYGYKFNVFFYFVKLKKSNYLLLRPLIFFSFFRNDISFLIRKYKIPLIFDKSNIKLLYTRNKIRLFFIPVLKILYNNMLYNIFKYLYK